MRTWSSEMFDTLTVFTGILSTMVGMAIAVLTVLAFFVARKFAKKLPDGARFCFSYIATLFVFCILFMGISHAVVLILLKAIQSVLEDTVFVCSTIFVVGMLCIFFSTNQIYVRKIKKATIFSKTCAKWHDKEQSALESIFLRVSPVMLQ